MADPGGGGWFQSSILNDGCGAGKLGVSSEVLVAVAVGYYWGTVGVLLWVGTGVPLGAVAVQLGCCCGLLQGCSWGAALC